MSLVANERSFEVDFKTNMIHIPVALKNYRICIHLYIDDHQNSTGDFPPIFEKSLVAYYRSYNAVS